MPEGCACDLPLKSTVSRDCQSSTSAYGRWLTRLQQKLKVRLKGKIARVGKLSSDMTCEFTLLALRLNPD